MSFPTADPCIGREACTHWSWYIFKIPPRANYKVRVSSCVGSVLSPVALKGMEWTHSALPRSRVTYAGVTAAIYLLPREYRSSLFVLLERGLSYKNRELHGRQKQTHYENVGAVCHWSTHLLERELLAWGS